MFRTDMRYFMWIFAIVIQNCDLSAATNCANPPPSIAPRECCNFPRLLKQNALDHCRDIKNKGNQCFYECVYAATELCRHWQCDYRKAEDYVDWVWPEAHDFKDTYKRAYKDCMAQAASMDTKNEPLEKKGCDPTPELIELCVQNKMFSLCPEKYFEWNKPVCTQERDFLENCVLDV